MRWFAIALVFALVTTVTPAAAIAIRTADHTETVDSAGRIAKQLRAPKRIDAKRRQTREISSSQPIVASTFALAPPDLRIALTVTAGPARSRDSQPAPPPAARAPPAAS